MSQPSRTSTSDDLRAVQLATIAPAAVQRALDALLAESLRPILVGLALFYALISVWYVGEFAATPEASSASMLELGAFGLQLSERAMRPLSTGVFSLGLLAAAVWFARNRLPAELAHPVAAVIGLAVVLNCLVLIVTGAEPRQTTNLIFAQIGFGCLLYRFRWYVLLSTASIAGWLWVVGARRVEPVWYHFGFALGQATLFGAMLLWLRLRAQRRLHELFLRDQVLKEQLKAAHAAARAAVQAKSEFLANMSHEIRTPMTAMLGMTELLQLSDLAVVQREYADTIARSGEALLQIVNDILDFSKIEAGQLSIEEIGFDLADVLEDVRELLSIKARQHGLALAIDVASDLPRQVRADPTRIRQVLVNLVGNALKFTHEGGVIVHASSREQLADGRFLLDLAVEDTGIGIAPEQRARVFESFTQADTATTRRYGGTGLGLAICNRLSVLMGGSLSLESEVGKGSTFHLTIPVSVEHAALRVAAASLPPPAAGSFRGRVLLVEDNQENQALAVRILQHFGCHVDHASDGAEALARLEGAQYDLVFMDCHMPILNGYDATRAIRAKETAGQHLPIVALSASVLPEERKKCLDVGMDDYVAKPFSRRDLETVLSRWL
jgi:signal transduction histidine kinase